MLTVIAAGIATEVPIAAIEAHVDEEAVLVAVYVAGDVVSMSVLALVTTLLYFDLRARADLPA